MLGPLRLAVVLAASTLLSLSVCTQPKDPPVIAWVEGSRSVEARDSSDYVCHAADLNPALLTFSWSVRGGRLGWDWSDRVRWFAPESSGHGFIRVVVTDEDGLSAADSFAIAIRAETAGVLSWDGAVKPGSFQSWADTLRGRYKLYGNCGSDTGEIFLLVMDDSNFAKWVAGQAATWLLQRRPWNTKDTFSVQISKSGLYYIVMDNTRGDADYSYYLSVWKAGP